MPELPEVETIRRQLSPLLVGRRLSALQIADPRWCAPVDTGVLRDALQGRRVLALWRRGKYLIWEAEGDAFLLAHLRMTGTLLYDASASPEPVAHERVRFTLDDDHDLRFCDPRRFGTGELALGRAALDAFLDARLGVEPLGPGFTAERLALEAYGRRAPVKALLLDQRRVAGVGNIYADEALFRARIHPLRRAGALRRAQIAALRDAVVAVLRAGIAAGGTTIDAFRHADGVRGAFQHELLVHRRRGQPCPTCGAVIVKLVAAGRGTYVCEVCQPVPRAVRRITPAPRAARAGDRTARRPASPGSRPAAPRR